MADAENTKSHNDVRQNRRTHRKSNFLTSQKGIGSPIGGPQRDMNPATARNADNDLFVLEGIPTINRGRGVIDPTPTGSMAGSKRSKRRKARKFVNDLIGDSDVTDPEFDSADIDEDTPLSLLDYEQDSLFPEDDFIVRRSGVPEIFEDEPWDDSVDYASAWREYLRNSGLDDTIDPNDFDIDESDLAALPFYKPQSDILGRTYPGTSVAKPSSGPKKFDDYHNKTKYAGDRYVITQQALTLARHRDLVAKSRWDTIHNAHYDWWAFPIDRGSGGYGNKYNIAGKPLSRLKRNKRFLNNVAEAIHIQALALGWDIDTDDYIADIDWDTGQDPWLAYPTRFWKMTRSAQILGLDKEFNSLLLLQASLSEGGIRFGRREYWDNPGPPGDSTPLKKRKYEYGDGTVSGSMAGNKKNTDSNWRGDFSEQLASGFVGGMAGLRKRMKSDSLIANPLHEYFLQRTTSMGDNPTTGRRPSDLVINPYAGENIIGAAEARDWFDFAIMLNDTQSWVLENANNGEQINDGLFFQNSFPRMALAKLLMGQMGRDDSEMNTVANLRRAGRKMMAENNIDGADFPILAGDIANPFIKKVESTPNGWLVTRHDDARKLWFWFRDEREQALADLGRAITKDRQKNKLADPAQWLDGSGVKAFFKNRASKQSPIIGPLGGSTPKRMELSKITLPPGRFANRDKIAALRNNGNFNNHANPVDTWLDNVSRGDALLSGRRPIPSTRWPMDELETRDWFDYWLMLSDSLPEITARDFEVLREAGPHIRTSPNEWLPQDDEQWNENKLINETQRRHDKVKFVMAEALKYLSALARPDENDNNDVVWEDMRNAGQSINQRWGIDAQINAEINLAEMQGRDWPFREYVAPEKLNKDVIKFGQLGNFATATPDGWIVNTKHADGEMKPRAWRISDSERDSLYDMIGAILNTGEENSPLGVDNATGDSELDLGMFLENRAQFFKSDEPTFKYSNRFGDDDDAPSARSRMLSYTDSDQAGDYVDVRLPHTTRPTRPHSREWDTSDLNDYETILADGRVTLYGDDQPDFPDQYNAGANPITLSQIGIKNGRLAENLNQIIGPMDKDERNGNFDFLIMLNDTLTPTAANALGRSPSILMQTVYEMIGAMARNSDQVAGDADSPAAINLVRNTNIALAQMIGLNKDGGMRSTRRGFLIPKNYGGIRESRNWRIDENERTALMDEIGKMLRSDGTLDLEALAKFLTSRRKRFSPKSRRFISPEAIKERRRRYFDERYQRDKKNNEQ